MVNLATAFLAASVVALFERTIDRSSALAVFMPVVAGMGGNAATQTLTVIVRGIALGELTWANSRKALLKEALGRRRQRRRAAARRRRWSCGSGRATSCSAAILALAMVINMFVAATAGTLIPLALRALKVDPALASSVFITTLTDVFGFFVVPGARHPVPQVPASAGVE